MVIHCLLYYYVVRLISLQVEIPVADSFRMSRIAMWLSLARVYSTGHKRRQVCLILAGVYVVLGILSLLLGSFACPNSAGGSRQRLDKCYANVPGKRSLLENVSLGVNVGEYLCLGLSCIKI